MRTARWVIVCAFALGAPTPARAQRPDSARGRDSVPAVRVSWEVQARYVFNHAAAGGTPTLDENTGGFQLRRARLVFTGSLPAQHVSFRVRPTYDRALGNLQLDDAWVAWKSARGWSLQAGQFKPLFLREENVSGFQQLTAERSYAADYFTLDYTQGVEVAWAGRRLRPSLAVHDGSYGANTDFTSDRTDFAVAGRLEWLLGGEWRQLADYDGWSGEGRALLVGVAIDYEHGESDTTRAVPSVVKYTVDVTAKARGTGLAAAIYGQRFDVGQLGPLPANLPAAHQWGLMVQGGLFAVRDRLELFGRYERMDFDGVYYRNAGDVVQSGSRNLATSALAGVTAGATWFARRHSAKLTMDVVYVPDPVPVRDTAGDLVRSDGERQIAVRAQAQFRF